MKTEIGGAVVIRVGALTYVQPVTGTAYWLDEVRGLIGRHSAGGRTAWSRPTPRGFEVVEVRETTVEQSKVIEALTVLAP